MAVSVKITYKYMLLKLQIEYGLQTQIDISLNFPDVDYNSI